MNPTSDPPNMNCTTDVQRLLLIPTGQVLLTRTDKAEFYAYTETVNAQTSLAPVVTAWPPTVAAGATVPVSGRLFNGWSQAVGYGNDYAAATNYPLVRITNKQTGAVRYCRTADHTRPAGSSTLPSMGVATGTTIVTTQVTVPPTIARGASLLVVVANGIPSKPVPITIT